MLLFLRILMTSISLKKILPSWKQLNDSTSSQTVPPIRPVPMQRHHQEYSCVYKCVWWRICSIGGVLSVSAPPTPPTPPTHQIRSLWRLVSPAQRKMSSLN